MFMKKTAFFIFAALAAGNPLFLRAGSGPDPAETMSGTPARTQYLLFQLAAAPAVPDRRKSRSGVKAGIEKELDAILSAVNGARGDRVNRQLGFMAGPLSFDQTDGQLRAFIKDSFATAEKKNVAVGFHIDDSMFWNSREDLWSDPGNVEWSDWNGTVVPHRIIGWAAGGKPFLAPPMCYNSRAIEAEASRLARGVIGDEIRKGLVRLKAAGRENLFAGVIAGWETRMQDDSMPPVYYGYCALHNLGYGPENPPKDMDITLQNVVRDWVALWTGNLRRAGIPRDRIYTHIAAPGDGGDALERLRGIHKEPNLLRDFYKNAAPDVVAFDQYSRPGFTVYGAKALPPLYKILSSHPDGPWGVSEGNAVSLSEVFDGSVPPGQAFDGAAAAQDMEHYLAGAFNHGASFVTLFGWSDGSSVFARTVTCGASVKAYRKFLRGERLQETAAEKDAAGELPSKIRRIQGILPRWLPRHPDRQPELRTLLKELDGRMKGGDPRTGETADRILGIVGDEDD
jgi:hypothetical protein